MDDIGAIDLGLMNIHCCHCDALHWFDERVSSSRVGQPEFLMCCTHGRCWNGDSECELQGAGISKH